jgi:hypothetical protein
MQRRTTGTWLWARLAAVLACAAVLSTLAGLGAEAQKVASPGPFSLTLNSGAIRIRGLSADLTHRVPAECGDGIDNDADGRVDLADGQCAAGTAAASTDDSELAVGHQPKVTSRLRGSIDGQGNIDVPVSGVSLPVIYVPVVGPDGVTAVVTATIVPTHPVVGTLDPITRAAQLRIRFRVALSGVVMGVGLGWSCSIGSSTDPIDIDVLSTGRADGDEPVIIGSPYNPATGTLRVVNNTFDVPGASGCPISFFYDVNGLVNQQMGLPSPSGSNFAILSGAVSPRVERAIVPVIAVDPPMTSFGDGAPTAPQELSFDATASRLVNGPGSFRWELLDASSGETLGVATGPAASWTFGRAGLYEVRVAVTDADGDVATGMLQFPVAPPDGGTTTGSTTTTTSVPVSTSTTTVPSSTTTTTSVPVSTSTTTVPSSTTTTARPTTTVIVPPATVADPVTTTTLLPTGPSVGSARVEVKIFGARRYAFGERPLRGTFALVGGGAHPRALVGSVTVRSPSGGAATVAVDLHRLWGLRVWGGTVVVRDPGAGLRFATAYLGVPSIQGSRWSARSPGLLWLDRRPELRAATIELWITDGG